MILISSFINHFMTFFSFLIFRALGSCLIQVKYNTYTLPIPNFFFLTVKNKFIFKYANISTHKDCKFQHTLNSHKKKIWHNLQPPATNTITFHLLLNTGTQLHVFVKADKIIIYCFISQVHRFIEYILYNHCSCEPGMTSADSNFFCIGTRL